MLLGVPWLYLLDCCLSPFSLFLTWKSAVPLWRFSFRHYADRLFFSIEMQVDTPCYYCFLVIIVIQSFLQIGQFPVGQAMIIRNCSVFYGLTDQESVKKSQLSSISWVQIFTECSNKTNINYFPALYSKRIEGLLHFSRSIKIEWKLNCLVIFGPTWHTRT